MRVVIADDETLLRQGLARLLVEAGFTPLEAIRIGTLNGATYLGRRARASR